jgi:hypothetical protein
MVVSKYAGNSRSFSTERAKIADGRQGVVSKGKPCHFMAWLSFALPLHGKNSTVQPGSPPFLTFQCKGV